MEDKNCCFPLFLRKKELCPKRYSKHYLLRNCLQRWWNLASTWWI